MMKFEIIPFDRFAEKTVHKFYQCSGCNSRKIVLQLRENWDSDEISLYCEECKRLAKIWPKDFDPYA